MKSVAFIFLSLASLAVSAQTTQNAQLNYTRYCASCHGVDGHSMLQGTPNLAANQALYKPDFQLIEALKRGSSKKPPMIGILSDRDLADILSYVRRMR